VGYKIGLLSRLEPQVEGIPVLYRTKKYSIRVRSLGEVGIGGRDERETT
jgi:hypothetical protein